MKKLILLLFSLQCCLYDISYAQQPGDLDSSFSADGMVMMPNTSWLDIAVQPDGKLLAVGSIIARYNIDGTLDGTFGINGIDTIKINDTIYRCNAINVQPDGKILVVGTPEGYADLQDILLIRYNSDGSLDNTFDGDGIVQTDFNGGSDDHGYKIVIQSDGKIIVAGSTDTYLALSRYHPDGSLDNTFDSDGKVVINTIIVSINYYWHEPAYMKLQSDGKILVGTVNQLVRLYPDGSFDHSFGINGVVTLLDGINDLAIQPDGKILLAGGDSYSALIMRLETNGDPDNTFGNNGIAKTTYQLGGPRQTATSITLQPDGKILAGGYQKYGALSDWRDFVLTRFDHDGDLDSSFNSDGQVITSFPGFDGETESHASLITPDMKIVLSGYYSYSSPNEPGFLARYHLGWIGWPVDAGTVSGHEENFIVSPNPTFDWVNIEVSDIDNGNWHLKLKDIAGRTILQEDIAARGGSIRKKVSLNELSTGLYFIQLDNGKYKMVSRVVKYK